jgi:protein subunit release factor A
MPIPPDDLKLEAYPIEGIDPRGGQHVGGHSGIRATHMPTGITAFVNIGRSQHVNKEIAVDMLLSAITHPRFR